MQEAVPILRQQHEWLENELDSNDNKRRHHAIMFVLQMQQRGQDMNRYLSKMIPVPGFPRERSLFYAFMDGVITSRSEITLLLICTLTKDSQDPNPLVRARAIRKLSEIQFPSIAECCAQPIARGLKDLHYFVRKTAVLAVLKLYFTRPSILEEINALETLQRLLMDESNEVIQNVLVTLCEIDEFEGGIKFFEILRKHLKSVFLLLHSKEWAQLQVLDILYKFIHKFSDEETTRIMREMWQLLCDDNSAVFLAAVKVVLCAIQSCQLSRKRSEQAKEIISAGFAKRMGAEPPEMQYMLLCNCHIILQQHPMILQDSFSSFLPSRTDPAYLIQEKLRLLPFLVTSSNYKALIDVFNEYVVIGSLCNNINLERRFAVERSLLSAAVSMLMKSAVRISEAVEMYFEALIQFILDAPDALVPVVLPAFVGIIRAYPGRYDDVIEIIFHRLGDGYDVDENSKIHFIWLLGTGLGDVDRNLKLLTRYSENYVHESVQMQLHLLTTSLKLFVLYPTKLSTLVHTLLEHAGDSIHVDIRERAVIYQRALSQSPSTLESILISPNVVSVDINIDIPELSLDDIGDVSSVNFQWE